MAGQKTQAARAVVSRARRSTGALNERATLWTASAPAGGRTASLNTAEQRIFFLAPAPRPRTGGPGTLKRFRQGFSVGSSPLFPLDPSTRRELGQGRGAASYWRDPPSRDCSRDAWGANRDKEPLPSAPVGFTPAPPLAADSKQPPEFRSG